MTRPMPPNLLADSGLPLAYPVAVDDDATPSAPSPGEYGTGIRAAVRSLTVMQKEAVVSSSGSATAWRLSSDEGPYLGGPR